MSRTEESRFWALVDKTGACWLWLGWRQKEGYGRFNYVKGRTIASHRWSYERLVAPIPDGLVLDHLCKNPPCVNPAHLEPVTDRVNILRGGGVAARHAVATHCRNGHPYNEENTYYSPDGSRACKTCRRRPRERISRERHTREVAAALAEGYQRAIAALRTEADRVGAVDSDFGAPWTAAADFLTAAGGGE